MMRHLNIHLRSFYLNNLLVVIWAMTSSINNLPIAPCLKGAFHFIGKVVAIYNFCCYSSKLMNNFWTFKMSRWKPLHPRGFFILPTLPVGIITGNKHFRTQHYGKLSIVSLDSFLPLFFASKTVRFPEIRKKIAGKSAFN